MPNGARGRRLAALSGLAFVVLLVVGSTLIGGTKGPGRHSLDASESEVTGFVGGTDHTRVWVGEYLAVLGYALFLVFAAYAWSVVRRDGERDWRDGALPAAAAIFVALAAIATALLAPALNRGAGGADAAARFLDLRSVMFPLAYVFFAVWMIVFGTRALRGGALPRWLAWSAAVIGALLLLGTLFAPRDPAFHELPTFAGLLWVAIASVVLARRDRAAAST